VKFSRLIVASLASVALLSGCGKSTAPTSVTTTTLDTTPPAAPSGLSVSVDGSGFSKLTWDPSTAADLADYQVYVYSPDPSRDNSFVMIWQTDGTESSYSLDPTAQNETRVFKVVAVDNAGNKSGFSSPLSVQLGPLPRVSDPVSGEPPVGHMTP